ncbi:YecA family protein [Bacillus paralicheniformis]|uniref:YecA family protein n=1 Tax=Bacillus paralicheniformis TaxID=1648923 RepID=UPI00189A2BE3|nr:SEC-C metal-binding domain-containing protein [Bacillus paralicheniformis]
MLSILKKELADFSELSSVRTNINTIYRELESENYDKVIQICDLSIEKCEKVKEKAITSKNEEIANSMFVVNAYCKVMKCYSNYWNKILEGKYKDSWVDLQDTINNLINVTKFMENQTEFGISEFNSHLNELEKLYPYSIFASSEMVIETKECSICGKSVLDMDCIHIPGNLYWGQMAAIICKDIVFQAVALVEHPMDKRCVIEISDDYRTDKEKFKLLHYFVENNTNPLKLFTVTETHKYYYNEKYHKYKRNDPCPCISGKKFKKCCGENKYERRPHFHIELKDDIRLRPLLITSES